MRAKTFFPLLIIILLAACASPVGTSVPTEPPTVTPTPKPSATAAPGIPLAILVIPTDIARDESTLYQNTIYDLAQAAGMRFQVRNTLATADIQMEPDLRVVIAFPPDPGLAALAAAAPQVQFLGVDIAGLSPAANLSLVGAAGAPIDQQAFIAGYIAAMLSLDYRVGVIVQQDTPAGQTSLTAFKNGYYYYCGLCNPSFPPWYTYPVRAEIPVGTTDSHLPAYVDGLRDYLVEVAYVQPEVATFILLDYMAQSDLKIIGQSLLLEELRENWVTSIQPDIIPALQGIWPDLLSGNSGQNISIPLILTEVNPDLLSEGKQRLAQEVLADLQAGFIGTGVTP